MKTILIADDHPVFRRGLRQAIEEQPGKWCVREAEDGEQAVRLCQAEGVDVAFLDFNMPKLDGLEVMRRLREEQRAVKTIMLTMYDDAVLAAEGMKLGARAFVLKDEAIEEILRALQLVLAGKKYLSPSLYQQPAEGESGGHFQPPASGQLKLLTQCERRILRLIADDLTSKQIADRLKCSLHTVNAHRQNMSAKLGLTGTHSLLKFAFAHRQSA